MKLYLLFAMSSMCTLLLSITYFISAELLLTTAIFTILYSGYGVSVGFHRLYSHDSFKTYEFVRKSLLYLGCQGAPGSPLLWKVLHNRSHHAHTDTELDIHSPTKGILYAFIGWIFYKENHQIVQTELFKLRKDIDPFAKWCYKNYIPIIITNLIVITILSQLIYGNNMLTQSSLNASALSLIISGIVNVVGHIDMKGLCYKTTMLKNNSTNNPWFVFLTWGESLHNNHHAHPRRIQFNTKWYEFDIGRWMIYLIQKRN